MKVFLSFFNGCYDRDDVWRMPPFYQSFVSGLQKAGNEVAVFASRWWKYEAVGAVAERRLKDSVRKFNPDLIIAFNNYGPDFASWCECPICIYEVDSPLYYGNQESILKHPDRYVYFTAQEASGEMLQKKFFVNKARIHEMPFFTELKAENIEKVQNIVFVGSRFTQPEFAWNRFMRGKPTSAERSAYSETIRTVLKNPFSSVNEALVASLSCAKRVEVLSEIADLGLTVYGTPDWGTEPSAFHELVLSYSSNRVQTLKENQAVYNASRLCINTNHVQALDGFSWRVCDVMASSACLVTEYNPGIVKRFPGLTLPTFTNRFEARELCKKLLADEARRLDVSSACQTCIEEHYRFRNALSRMEEVLGVSLHGGAPGKIEFFTYADPEKRSVDRNGSGDEMWKRWASRHHRTAIMISSCCLFASCLPGGCHCVPRSKWQQRMKGLLES